MPELTREQIIAAAREAAGQVQGPLTLSDFIRLTGITEYYIEREFPEGRWGEVKSLANLERHYKDRDPLSDDELLSEFHRVATEVGDIPTWAVFSSRARISRSVVTRRFGGLRGTLIRYHDWLQQNCPNSSLLAQLQTRSRHEVPPAPPPPSTVSSAPSSPSWSRLEGPQFGRPIDFRGLRHAPINEQGVVFLFGMVSYELGFIVEAVHDSYPDCEAKRCIDSRNQRWQRVRIEFEYRSGNFRDHGHNPAGCEVIVCWEHDWHECPIEVVELRRVIDELAG